MVRRVHSCRKGERASCPRVDSPAPIPSPLPTPNPSQLVHQRLRGATTTGGLGRAAAPRVSSSSSLHARGGDAADAAPNADAPTTTTRRTSLLSLLSAPAAAFSLPGIARAAEGKGAAVGAARVGTKYVHTEQEWKAILADGVAKLGPVEGGKLGEPGADFRYRVLRTAYTELPLSSGLYTDKRKGTYVCAGCGSAVYRSDAKYNSGEKREERGRRGRGRAGRRRALPIVPHTSPLATPHRPPLDTPTDPPQLKTQPTTTPKPPQQPHHTTTTQAPAGHPFSRRSTARWRQTSTTRSRSWCATSCAALRAQGTLGTFLMMGPLRLSSGIALMVLRCGSGRTTQRSANRGTTTARRCLRS